MTKETVDVQRGYTTRNLGETSKDDESFDLYWAIVTELKYLPPLPNSGLQTRTNKSWPKTMKNSVERFWSVFQATRGLYLR